MTKKPKPIFNKDRMAQTYLRRAMELMKLEVGETDSFTLPAHDGVRKFDIVRTS